MFSRYNLQNLSRDLDPGIPPEFSPRNFHEIYRRLSAGVFHVLSGISLGCFSTIPCSVSLGISSEVIPGISTSSFRWTSPRVFTRVIPGNSTNVSTEISPRGFPCIVLKGPHEFSSRVHLVASFSSFVPGYF